MNSIMRKGRMIKLLIEEFIARLKHQISVRSTDVTLCKIMDEHLSVARFGDSEFNLILGKDLIYQEYSSDISFRMRNVLCDNERNNHCLVCIPYAYYSLDGFTTKSKWFWLKYFAQYRKQIEPYLNPQYTYYDAQISRIYINRSDKNKSASFLAMWKKIWKDQDILIVEGRLSRFGVGNTLLDSAKSVRRIICPSENAFEKYDDIVRSIMSIDRWDLVLISLGPTATLLAYDLSQRGMWAIDAGNMDMEYEWMSLGTKRAQAIRGKYTIEAPNGTNVDCCNDSKYLSQIIKTIV